MPTMTEQDRARLRNELMQLSYGRAKGRINRLDPAARLRHWRNAQRSGEWHTTYDMPGTGTRVTLVETIDPAPAGERVYKRNYTLVDVRVEPLPEKGGYVPAAAPTDR